MSRPRLLKSRVYPGWYVVAAGAAIQLIFGSLLGQSFGAYVVLLQQDLGWSKASISGAVSMMSLENGLLGPPGGWLVDRFGSRSTMRVGICIFGLGFMLFSRVDSLQGFYLCFALMAIGQNIGGFMPLTVAIVNWFSRHRTAALAAMQTGGSLGGIAVPIVVFALETLGWRTTAFVSGILIIALGLPLTQLVRRRPEDYGFEVDGGPGPLAETSAARQRATPANIAFRPREALRTRAFWLLALGHGSALLVVSAVNVHLVPHLYADLHYSLEAAGFVVGLLAMTQIAGQLAGGVLGDRFSKRSLVVVCMGMHAAGLLLLAYATALPMVIAFTTLHGLGWGVRAPLMQAIRADYFGTASFGSIMGWASLITTIGSTSGPLVAGFLADATGSYTIGFTILALLAGAGSIFFVLAVAPAPPARLREAVHSGSSETEP